MVFALVVFHHIKLWTAEERFPFDTKNPMRRLHLKIFTDNPNAFSDFGSTSFNGFRLWVLFLMASIGPITGCSSAISMREALRDSIDQAAAVSQLTVLSEIEANSSDETLFDNAATASYAPEPSTAPEHINETQSEAYESQDISLDIEMAVSTLSEAGVLDAASKAALVETLAMTPEADWPIVIEEFTTMLSTLRTTDTAPALYPDASEIKNSDPDELSAILPPASAKQEEVTSFEVIPEEVIQESVLDSPVDTVSSAIGNIESNYDSEAIASSSMQSPPTELTTETPFNRATGNKTASDSEIDITDYPSSKSQPIQKDALVIHRPCIAQKVLGWGMVETFPQNKLFPGSEVLVYFELTGIKSKSLDQGFETSIETSLRLDDAAGKRLHNWSFPPLVEVCASVRRDYFARFFVNLPSKLPPGDHQLVLTVTDSYAGTTAETVLPFVIIPGESVSSTVQ